MIWSDVFGEIWFWALALMVWLGYGLRVGGAPRKLVALAMKTAPEETGPALFLRDFVRWRLGPGRLCPTGLLPLRLPFLGAVAALLAMAGVLGDARALALLTVLWPQVMSVVVVEPQVQKAVDAARTGDGPALAAFADRIEQLWRLKLATVGVSVLTTAAAAVLTQP